MNRNTKLISKLFTEFFVPDAFRTSQLKVAMGCMNTIAQTVQKASKCHTVRATRETYQIGFSLNHQMMLQDILLDGIGYSVHKLFKNKPFHRLSLTQHTAPGP